jgi:hypothetical protein
MNFIKANAVYEIETNGNKYQFSIPANAPLGEAYDVVYRFLSLIAEQAKVASNAMKPAEPLKEEKAEVVK